MLVDRTADAASTREATAKIFDTAVGFKTFIVIEVRVDEDGDLTASSLGASRGAQ